MDPKTQKSLEDFNDEVLAGKTKPAFKPQGKSGGDEKKFKLGTTAPATEGPAQSLEAFTDSVVAEPKKKSGGQESGSTAPTVPSSSEFGGEPWNPFRTFMRSPSTVDIDGQQVNISGYDPTEGPFTTEKKKELQQGFQDRLANKNITEQDAQGLSRVLNLPVAEAKTAFNKPVTYSLVRANKFLQEDIALSATGPDAQNIPIIQQKVLRGDGKALNSYFQGRKAQLTKEIDDIETKQQSLLKPDYDNRVFGHQSPYISDPELNAELETKKQAAIERMKRLEDATAKMFVLQYNKQFDVPDEKGNLVPFNGTNAQKFGEQIKGVFDPVGATNDEKRRLSGYPLSQTVQFQNTKRGYEARIMTLAQQVEDAKDMLDQMKTDKNVERYNRLVSDYNDVLDKYPKLSDDFPEVRRAELTQGVLDAYYKRVQAQRLVRTAEDAATPTKFGLGTARNILGYIINETPDEEDYAALSKETGLSVDELKDLDKTNKSIKTGNIRVDGVLSNLASSMYAGLKGIQKFGVRRLSRYDAEKKSYINEQTDKLVQNATMKPTETNLYEPESKIDLQRYDKHGKLNPYFLRQRLNEDYQKFNLNPQSFVNTVGQLAGNLALFGGQARLTGVAFKGLASLATGATELEAFANAGAAAEYARKSERFGELAGTFGSAFAQSYDDYYKAASAYTNDDNRRDASAAVNASIEGLTEMILPDVDIAKAMRGEKRLFPLFDKLVTQNKGIISRGVIQKYALGIADMLKVQTGESFEEVMNAVGTALSDQAIIGKKYNASDVAENAKQAFVTTFIGTLPSGVGAGIGTTSQLKKETLFEAGATPTLYKGYVNDLVERGKLSQEQANKQLQTINTMADIVKNIPDRDGNGVPFSTEQKIEIAAQEYRIRRNMDMKKNTTIQAVADFAEADTKEAQKTQQEVLLNQPIYKIDDKEVTKQQVQEAIDKKNEKGQTIEVFGDNQLQEQARMLEGKDMDVAEKGLRTIVSPIKSTTDGGKSENAQERPSQKSEVVTNKPEAGVLEGKEQPSRKNEKAPEELLTQNQEKETKPAPDFSTEDIPEAVRGKIKPPVETTLEEKPKQPLEQPQSKTETENRGTWTPKDYFDVNEQKDIGANLSEENNKKINQIIETALSEGKAPKGYRIEKTGQGFMRMTEEDSERAVTFHRWDDGHWTIDTATGGKEGSLISRGIVSIGIREGNAEAKKFINNLLKTGGENVIRQRPTTEVGTHQGGDQGVGGKEEGGRVGSQQQGTETAKESKPEKKPAAKRETEEQKVSRGAERLTEMLNEGRKGAEKYELTGISKEGKNYLLTAVNKKGEIVSNVLDAQGKTPEGMPANWRMAHMALNDVINAQPMMKGEKELIGKLQGLKKFPKVLEGFLKNSPRALVRMIQQQATGIGATGEHVGEPALQEMIDAFNEDIVKDALAMLPSEQVQGLKEKYPGFTDNLSESEKRILDDFLKPEGITTQNIIEHEQKNDIARLLPETQVNAPADTDVVSETVPKPTDVGGTGASEDTSSQELSAPKNIGSSSEQQKLKQKLADKKKAFKDALTKARGQLSAGIDPEVIIRGVDLMLTYAEVGITKFGDIVRDLINEYGAKFMDKENLDAIRGVYAYHRVNLPKEERLAYENEEDVDDFVEKELPGLLAPEEPTSTDYVPARNNTAEKNFVNLVKDAIHAGHVLNIIQLRKLAKSWGLDETDIYLQEKTELAVVELVREVVNSNLFNNDNEKLEKIIEIYEHQPSLNQRSSSRIEKQQYSTPAPIAFSAGSYLGYKSPNLVLEPSAGNGMLTIYFDPYKVHANEIDELRLSNLGDQGFGLLTNQDATEPFTFRDPKFKYDAVITNPPFGSAPVKNYEGYKISGLDEQMAINALQSMHNTGRAAIIMGGHSSYDEQGRLKGDRTFFNYLHNKYNVADVINIDGSLYSRQGTSFPIRLILINGRKLFEDGAAPLYNGVRDKMVTSFQELFDRIQEIKEINNENIRPDNYTEPARENVEPSISGERTSKGNDRVSTEHRYTAAEPNNAGITSSSEEQRQLPELGEQTRSGAVGPADQGVYVEPVPRKFDTGQLANEKVKYIPRSKGKSVDTVTPLQMAAEADKVLDQIDKEKGGIDNYVQNELSYPNKEALYKAFSAEQIDAIAMGMYQIEKGQGVIVGDQTGVGKGRIAAAFIRYGRIKGMRPTFLTEKPNLFSDLYRDLVAIGSENLVPFIVNDKSSDKDPSIRDSDGNIVHKPMTPSQKKPYLEKGELPPGTDFVLGTYSQFSSAKPSTKKSFFFQVSQDNTLVMDESHNVSGDSNTGAFFQEVLKGSRGVVYLSATFAKRPDNMPVYAARTAMQEANMTKDELIYAIERGGVALQEVVSSQLVESGQMIRRERSFDGVSIDYDVLTDKKAEHWNIADGVTDIVRDLIDFQAVFIQPILKGLDKEAAAEGELVGMRTGVNMAGVDNVPFASKVFNVIDQLLFSLKANDVADKAIEELKQGRKPVIAFKSTMESFLKNLDFNPGDKLDKVDFTLTLKRGLDGLFRYTRTNAQGDKIKETLSVSDLSQQGQDEYRFLLNKIRKTSMNITVSPIDAMIKRIKDAGFTVEEITGRDMVVEMQDDGSGVVARRTDKDVIKKVKAFNDGKLDVIMINASGATGLSLHASVDDKQAKDKRQRVMISGQLELDINKEVQKRGRIDRTGQVQRGAYRYVVSSIPAESRLLMMFKAKLKSLDANTTSSQKSKQSEVEVTDFLNKYGDKVVFDYLRDNGDINQRLLDPLKILDKSEEELADMAPPEESARKVTGRVAILNSKDQEKFYNEVTQQYADLLEYLESNNSNDLEVKTLPLNATVTSSYPIIVGKGGNSAFGSDSILEQTEVDVLRKPLTKEELDGEIKEAIGNSDPQKISNALIKDLTTYYDDRIEQQLKEINEDFDKKAEMIPEKVRVDAEKKELDSKEAAAMEQQMLENNEVARQAKLQRIRDKEESIMQNTQRRFTYFRIGTLYDVPMSVHTDTNATFSKGVFLGFTIKGHTKNKYAPSNIVMRFATTDSRRVVTVPTSQNDWINAVVAASVGMSRTTQDRVLESWDHQAALRNRMTRYIITGNLLQAYGTNDGHLVSYTTKEGDLRKGILLAESYKPQDQKVRLPVGRAYDIFRTSNSPITTTDQEVTITHERGGFTIDVPLSKAAGGKYFLDPELRDLIQTGEFHSYGGKMTASFTEENLRKVLELLQNKHSSAIEINSAKIPSAPKVADNDKTHEALNPFDWAADQVGKLKVNDKDKFFDATLGIPITIWNGAISIVQATLKAGGILYNGIREAINYIKENHVDSFDEKTFTDTIRAEMLNRGLLQREMSKETMKHAKAAIKNIERGATINDEVQKVKDFYDKLKPSLEQEDIDYLDEEVKMLDNYLRENAIEIPPGASRNRQDAWDKQNKMKEGIEERILNNYTPTTIWEKAKAEAAAKIDELGQAKINRLFNVPNAIQDKTVAWLSGKISKGAHQMVDASLEAKNGAVRTIGKTVNSLFANMGKEESDIAASERFKGEVKSRALADAIKIKDQLYELIDKNKSSLTKIDQVIDPEHYDYLFNLPLHEFAEVLEQEEPGIQQQEVADRYKKMRENFGFSDPAYKPLTKDDLTPEESSVYSIVRELYDFVHELNYAMGRIPKEAYYKNYQNYSGRLYDQYEIPEEVNKMVNGTSTAPIKMDLDLYMGREALTNWKALHRLQDPVYTMTKRLYQTLSNKAVHDYANYLVTNKPDTVSNYERPGYTRLGYGFGPITNRWVRDDIAEDFKGFYFANDKLNKFYDFIKAYDRLGIRQLYKKIFTVYNPGIHLANIMSNYFFGFIAGINPMRLTANLIWAKQQIDSYGPEYRRALSDGIIGNDFSRADLVKITDELFGKKEDDNTENALGIHKAGPPLPVKYWKSFLKGMRDFYRATDDVFKLSAYKSFRQLGYSHEKAADMTKEKYQNYNRVGKMYDVSSKVPLIGNPFVKFAGDLARIVVSGLKERPLMVMGFMASLQAISLMMSQAAGETEEQRRKRINRPGTAKIPVPEFFPEWLGGGQEGGIALSWKVGQNELNIAKYLSPVFMYSAYDGDNSIDFLNKFSPLPLESGDDYSYNPNGVWATILAKNANDPLLAPLAQTLVDSDFRGVPILDPDETKYRKSLLTDGERRANALRFLARSYVPHGAYADDFLRTVTGHPDYYNRPLKPTDVLVRFMGYKSQPWEESRYDDVVQKRLKYWAEVFSVEDKRMSALESQHKSGKIDAEKYEERKTGILEDQATVISKANKEMSRMLSTDRYFQDASQLRQLKNRFLKQTRDAAKKK